MEILQKQWVGNLGCTQWPRQNTQIACEDWEVSGILCWWFSVFLVMKDRESVIQAPYRISGVLGLPQLLLKAIRIINKCFWMIQLLAPDFSRKVNSNSACLSYIGVPDCWLFLALAPYLETSILLFWIALCSYTPRSPPSYLSKPYLGPVPPLSQTTSTFLSLSPYPLCLAFFIAPSSPCPFYSTRCHSTALFSLYFQLPVSLLSLFQTFLYNYFCLFEARIVLFSLGALTGSFLVLCYPSLPSSVVYHKQSWFVSVLQLPSGRVLGIRPNS